MTRFIIPVYDNDGDVGRSGFPVDPTSLDAALTSLYSAVDALTVGTMGTAQLQSTIAKDAGSTAASADPQARKNRGFRVYYETDTNQLTGSVTIPCADATLVPGVEELDISAGVGATLKSAFEAVGQHPKTGESVTVTKILFLN